MLFFAKEFLKNWSLVLSFNFQGSLQWKIMIEDQCTFLSLTGMFLFVSVLHFVFVLDKTKVWPIYRPSIV